MKADKSHDNTANQQETQVVGPIEVDTQLSIEVPLEQMQQLMNNFNQ